jgi:hypothetical protein
LTVIHDLGRWDKGLGSRLANIIKSDHTLTSTNDIKLQWESLVNVLAHSAKIPGPVLIILDAFDESGDPASRRTLLSILVNEPSALPANIRILVTSRLESDVQEELGRSKVKQKLMENVPSTHDDILQFVRHEMRVNTNSEMLDESKCLIVTRKSGDLFLYASITCKFIHGVGCGGKTAEERFQVVVSAGDTKVQGNLDELYSEVLQKIFDMTDPVVKKRFTRVMSYLLAAYTPLSKKSLSTISQYSDVGRLGELKVNEVVDYLGSLLIGVSDCNTPIQLCHTTFREYLSDPDRSKDFYIDTGLVQEELLTACINLMSSPTEGLQFNICNFPTSHLPNNKISGLQEKVLAKISPGLAYCCHYWARHLSMLESKAASHLKEVTDFLTKKFLYWLEALSLLSGVNSAYDSVAIIRSLLEQVKVSLFIPYTQIEQELMASAQSRSIKFEELCCRSKAFSSNIWKKHQ